MLFPVGIDSSGGDAHCSGYTHHVYLPSTPWTVWVQWACHQPASRCTVLCSYVCLTQSARVMLTCNLWVGFGLVNGAMGIVEAICYRTGGPPNLPLAVMVHFDKYSGPTLHNGVGLLQFGVLGLRLVSSVQDYSFPSN